MINFCQLIVGITPVKCRPCKVIINNYKSKNSNVIKSTCFAFELIDHLNSKWHAVVVYKKNGKELLCTCVVSHRECKRLVRNKVRFLAVQFEYFCNYPSWQTLVSFWCMFVCVTMVTGTTVLMMTLSTMVTVCNTAVRNTYAARSNRRDKVKLSATFLLKTTVFKS